MTPNFEAATVGRLVTERLSRARVFDRYGLDYSCKGCLTLKDSCAFRGVSVKEVERSLAESDARLPLEDQVDWEKASISELIENILTVHHDFMREELPRLALLVDKVFVSHARKYPEMADIKRAFETFRDEMERHMAMEEHVLFPMCRQLERAVEPPRFACGTVQDPIQRLQIEHQETSDGMDQIRRLTQQYTPPSGACNTYKAMLMGLEALEKDIHRHIHKENNLLFPKVAQVEARLKPRCDTISQP